MLRGRTVQLFDDLGWKRKRKLKRSDEKLTNLNEQLEMSVNLKSKQVFDRYLFHAKVHENEDIF